jgi:hypothetical protein
MIELLQKKLGAATGPLYATSWGDSSPLNGADSFETCKLYELHE